MGCTHLKGTVCREKAESTDYNEQVNLALPSNSEEPLSFVWTTQSDWFLCEIPCVAVRRLYGSSLRKELDREKKAYTSETWDDFRFRFLEVDNEAGKPT